MALTNNLVVLFIAVLLQIFLGNFYSNASCLSLLWLYLGNSQVSIYRTIGPTLVVKPSHYRHTIFSPPEPLSRTLTGELTEYPWSGVLLSVVHNAPTFSPLKPLGR